MSDVREAFEKWWSNPRPMTTPIKELAFMAYQAALSTPPADVTLRGALEDARDFIIEECGTSRSREGVICRIDAALARQPKVLVDEVQEIVASYPYREGDATVVLQVPQCKKGDRVRVIVVEEPHV